MNIYQSGRILSILSLVLTIISLIIAVADSKSIEGISEPYWWVIGGLFLFFLISLAFKKSISQALYRFGLFLRNKKPSTILVNKRILKISLLEDTGTYASLIEETYFERISKKKNYSSKIEVEGEFDIKTVKTNNCSYKQYDNGNVEFYYLSAKSNTSYSPFGRTSYYSYSACLDGTFLNADENWDTMIRHPTRLMEIQVIFPHNRPPIFANIYKLIEGQEPEFVSNAIFIRTPAGVKLLSKQFNPQTGSIYSLKWSW